jgi:cell division transport system permease protein
MANRKNKTRNRQGLQVFTLCISTSMVLILLGMVVFTVFTARNLSSYIKENLTVVMQLSEDITDSEAQQLCDNLK